MQSNELLMEKDFTLRGIWDNQHPLIHTWFVMSTVSICLMSAFFFVF